MSFGFFQHFLALVSKVASTPAKHAKVIVEALLMLIGGELTILPELVG